MARERENKGRTVPRQGRTVPPPPPPKRWRRAPAVPATRRRLRPAGGSQPSSADSIGNASSILSTTPPLFLLSMSLATRSFQSLSSSALAFGRRCSSLIILRRAFHTSSVMWFSCRTRFACLALLNGSIQNTSSIRSSRPLPKTGTVDVPPPAAAGLQRNDWNKSDKGFRVIGIKGSGDGSYHQS